jgi:hypothetical protein
MRTDAQTSGRAGWAALAALAATLAPAIASAQQPAQAEPPVRGYLVAQAGVSHVAGGAALLGIEVGDAITRDIQAYASFSYLDNILRTQVREALDTLGASLSNATGVTRQFHGRDLGLALTAGAKFVRPVGPVYPYVGLGGGGIRLKRTITERTLGNVTAAVLPVIGDEGLVGTNQASATRPIGEALVGVAVVAGRGYLDGGVRFRKVFHTGESFDFWQFAIGAGIRF